MISIVLTVHNKEWLISRVVNSIVDNTILDAELIVVFDGCTDKSEEIVDAIDKKNLRYKKLYAADVFETMANNIGMKASLGEYIIIIQDDMVINEMGWDKTLLEPFSHNDVFAVSARAAHNYGPRGNELESVTDYIDKRLADRGVFYIRNSVNRGPLAFRKRMLQDLNYLDEIYAPYTFDEHDICYRAYKEHRWVSGLYVIDYISEQGWGTTRSKNHELFYSSHRKNANIFYERHSDIIEGINHNEQRIIKKRIYIFYHIYLFDKINVIISEQLNRLIKSGVLKNASLSVTIMDCYNGTYEVDKSNLELLNKYAKEILVVKENLYELITLKRLYEHALYHDGHYLYMHTKGSTRVNDPDQENFQFGGFTGNYSYRNVLNWRDIMEHFCIDHWEICNYYLDKGFDLAGCNYMKRDHLWAGLMAHYSGNFWWATSNFIKKLADPFTYGFDRLNAEFWIGRIKHRAICLYPLPSKREDHNRFIVYTDPKDYLNKIIITEYEN